jgi:arsenate reductase-like glutaredoxin family protein
MTDAKKRTMGKKEALALAAEVDEIYATKGARVIHLDMRADQPDAETLRALLIGPSGNLRAPTLRVGKTLLVGFDEATYKKILGR